MYCSEVGEISRSVRAPVFSRRTILFLQTISVLVSHFDNAVMPLAKVADKVLDLKDVNNTE